MSRQRVLAASLALVAAVGVFPPAPAAQQVQTSQRPGEVASPRQGMPPRDAATPAQTVGTAIVKGVIVDADTGQPLRRASVSLFARGQREPRGTTTNDQGGFEIRELPPGDYTVSAQKGGYVRASLGQRRQNEPGRTLTVRDGEKVDAGTIALMRGGVITGRVVDEIGEPVMDINVRVMRKVWMRGRQRLAQVNAGGQTNDLGAYRVYGLQPGDYYVSAVSRGFGRMFGQDDTAVEYAPTFFPGTTDAASARTVTVHPGQETLVDLSLIQTRVTKLTGLVMGTNGKPLSGGRVAAVRRSESEIGMPEGPRGASVREDGSFTLTGMTPGTWTLSASAQGGFGFGPEGDREFAELSVGIGEEDVAGVVLVMGRAGTVRGRLTFEGTPPADLSRVMVSSRPLEVDTPRMAGGGRPVNPGPDGSFELSGLTGTVILGVSGLSGDWGITGIRYGGRDVYDTGLDVPMGRILSGVDIVLSQDRTKLTGTVTDDRGSPIKDFFVLAFHEDREKWFAPSGRYLMPGRGNQEGIFTITGLPPGRYVVLALEALDTSSYGDPDELERLRGFGTVVSLGAREQKNLTLQLAKP